jgi:hypothetical protein
VTATKAEILKLMPSDTHTLSFSVQHTSSGSCAFWNLQSDMLGKYLSAPKVGDARGVIGIGLSSETSSGESAYSMSDTHRHGRDRAAIERDQLLTSVSRMGPTRSRSGAHEHRRDSRMGSNGQQQRFKRL